MSVGLEILGTGFVVGIATFVTVEAIAYQKDKSGITGLIWGTILSILFATIVDISMLLIMVKIQ